MPNPNGAKGTRFETDVTREFLGAGVYAVKPRQAGDKDIGDIHVGPDIVAQAKAWKNVTSALREGTKGAQLQAKRAKRPFGVTIIKKAQAPIRDAYVAMPLHVFISLLKSRQLL